MAGWVPCFFKGALPKTTFTQTAPFLHGGMPLLITSTPTSFSSARGPGVLRMELPLELMPLDHIEQGHSGLYMGGRRRGQEPLLLGCSLLSAAASKRLAAAPAATSMSTTACLRSGGRRATRPSTLRQLACTSICKSPDAAQPNGRTVGLCSIVGVPPGGPCLSTVCGHPAPTQQAFARTRKGAPLASPRRLA